MSEYMYIVWIILIAAFAAIEVTTFNLITIWMAAGALFALIAERLGAGVLAQIWTFLLASAVLVIATKPLVKKVLRPKNEATNADRIVGKPGVVTETIDAVEGKGQVKVMGSIWSARASDGKTIEEGTPVIVTAIEGVKVTVEVKREA